MMLRSTTLLLLLICGTAAAQSTVRMNLGATLSEDDGVAAALEASLSAFLDEASSGRFSDACVAPEQLELYGFFFQGLTGLGLGEHDTPPTVLKSYPLDDARYAITVAFAGVRDGAPFLSKIVELEASPHAEGYRFGCPFATNTSNFRVTTLGSVSFHSSGELDEQAAADFVRFKTFFSELTQVPDEQLDYYCFESLDELLTSYGFVYDAGKCNFLRCDLGFAEDGGRRYLTGTGDPNYVYEYVGEALAHSLPRSDELYWPFVSGMSCYFGGYALSGDDMAELKAQFRARLRAEPEIDFLAEFRKARKSSVNRHFSYFVMCAFLCEEVIETRGFDQALRLAYSGGDGARFFAELEAVLGVGEADFHDTIVRLISEDSSQGSAPTGRR